MFLQYLFPTDFFLRSTHTLSKQYSVFSQGNDRLLNLAIAWLHLGYTLGITWVEYVKSVTKVYKFYEIEKERVIFFY